MKNIDATEIAYKNGYKKGKEDSVADLESKSKWIPVTERLPDEDTRVLVWLVDGANKYTRMDTDRRHNSKWVRWEKYVTHWMPLPEPPEE